MKKLIIMTGSAGFVGSHFVDHILETTDYNIVGIDSFKHGGFSARVRNKLCDRYKIITHDLSTPIDGHTANEIFSSFEFDKYSFFHVASRSHVDDSITDPVPFILNNVSAALYTLEFIRNHQGKLHCYYSVNTDECFGPANTGQFHKEWDVHLPSNAYSASKSSQQQITFSYWRMYNLPVVTTYTMNLFGPMQGREKYVPKIIRSIYNQEELPIHADSQKKQAGTRMYLHCRNLADAWLYIDKNITPKLYNKGENLKHESFNIAGLQEIDNHSLAVKVSEIMQKPLVYKFVDFHSARAGHDLSYRLCSDKLLAAGWKYPYSFEESLKMTVDWYLNHKEWLI